MTLEIANWSSDKKISPVKEEGGVYLPFQSRD